ncbi:MAG: hypothetical protein KKB13_06635 [Chloroflexi bacterium]|nr:hypothetical protein [Chloroflexota bacterium]
MSISLAETWYAAFMTTLQRHEATQPLKAAAAAEKLGNWTEALTGVVVDVCQQMGWETAAKWHPADVLPVKRSEHLALDAVAFDVRPGLNSPCWPFPVAVFELENSPRDDQVAYSLWKTLCVRAALRVVFCYRWDASAGSALARYLSDTVAGSLSIPERVNLTGETLLVVGSRAEESTFPYGFFKDWVLDKNTGRFSRI